MILRKATYEDAELLLTWRNDPVTRKNSFQQDEFSLATQLEWLAKCFNSGTCMIWIGEVASTPVGKVRANFLDGLCELSWTVAPTSRGHGYGKQLVKSAIELIPNNHFLARIKDFNLASEGIAKSLGFQLIKEEAGVGFWELRRPE